MFRNSLQSYGEPQTCSWKRRLLLLMIVGERSLQSRVFLCCGPTGFLNRYYSNGGFLCPRGQLWWSRRKLTHSAQGRELFHLLIHQNAQILKSYHPLPNRFNLFLIGFKWNYVGPGENPADYFLWNPFLRCHLFQSEKSGLIAVMRSSSGWNAGDTCQRRLAVGEMRQWPCNWPWLHTIDRSNCATMKSAFWCRPGYNFFAPLNWLSGKLSCGALWVTGPTRFKGRIAHTASWWHPILS